MNRWMDSDQTCTDTLLGQPKEMFNFHELDLIFKGNRNIYSKQYFCQHTIYNDHIGIDTSLGGL